MKDLMNFSAGSNDEIIFKAKLQSAQNGNLAAMANVAELLYEGTGCTQDKAEAAAWYRKAYGKGDLTAGYNLAAMAFYGDGVEKDLKSAKKIFQDIIKMAKRKPYAQVRNIIENISSFADDLKDAPEEFVMSHSERYCRKQIQEMAANVTVTGTALDYLEKQRGRKTLLESSISPDTLNL